MDHTEGCSLVAERGASDIGQYVSVGRLVFQSDGKRLAPAMLTVARRYLSDDDPCVKLSAWEVVFQIAGKIDRGCREKEDDIAPQAPAPWKLLMSL